MKMNNMYFGEVSVEKAYTDSGIVKSINDSFKYAIESEQPYSLQYLTLVPLSGSTTFGLSGTSNTFQYSIDNGTSWNNLTSANTVTTSTPVLLKATSPTISQDIGIGNITASNSFDLQGNVMSLLYGDNFAGKTDLTGKAYVFSKLFKDNSHLENAENVILPATTIADSCYRNMFDRCTSMKTSPKILPAMTLAANCYRGMFVLTKISKIPELPATTLAESCYEYMFQLCNNLKVISDNDYEHWKNPNAPKKLPATTLAPRCYANMFYECTGLTNVADLYLPSTTLASECYFQMFRRCSNIMTAPKLPAPTLVYQCYRAMFAECSKLQHIRCCATNISAENCLYYWVGGVASSGTFFKSPDMNENTYQRGQNGIPKNWYVRDNSTC